MGFMLVTAFVSMWITNTATTAMMTPIMEAVLKQLDKEYAPKIKIPKTQSDSEEPALNEDNEAQDRGEKVEGEDTEMLELVAPTERSNTDKKGLLGYV